MCSVSGSSTIGVPQAGIVTVGVFTYSIPTSVRTYHNVATGGGTVVTSIHAIQIRWKAPDLSLLESQPIVASKTTTSSGPMQSVPPSTSGEAIPQGSNKLSAGAIAGVVVGVVVLFLTVVAAFAIHIRRHKRTTLSRKSDREEAELDGKKLEHPLSELPSNRQVAPQSDVHEMDATRQLAVQELASGGLEQPFREVSSEMAADKHGELLPGLLGQPAGELPTREPIQRPSEPPSGGVEQPPGEMQALPTTLTGVEASTGIDAGLFDMEMASLSERQSQLLKRKQRLMELETIEAEEEKIRQRMAMLEKQRHGDCKKC